MILLILGHPLLDKIQYNECERQEHHTTSDHPCVYTTKIETQTDSLRFWLRHAPWSIVISRERTVLGELNVRNRLHKETDQSDTKLNFCFSHTCVPSASRWICLTVWTWINLESSTPVLKDCAFRRDKWETALIAWPSGPPDRESMREFSDASNVFEYLTSW